jgi:predicted NAD/FAD-binding protein
VAATLLSLAQRSLSTRVRDMRRRATGVTGTVEYRDGRVEELTAAVLTGEPERALRLLAAAVTTLAVAMVLARA